MSEPFVGEIRMFASNFPPRGWAFCDGQLLAVSQNDALFSLLGTTYGGDGRTTFGLPDLRGRLPLHAGGGSGPGLTQRRLGDKGGAESHTLSFAQASHGHDLVASRVTGDVSQAAGSIPADTGSSLSYHDTAAPTAQTAMTTGTTGGTQSHTNLMPFLCVHFIIALFGIYPSRH